MVYRGDLPFMPLSQRVRAGEQALADPGQVQSNDWDDPDLVFGYAGARVAQSTDPFALARAGVLVFAAGPM
jgi:hypothetical protein